MARTVPPFAPVVFASIVLPSLLVGCGGVSGGCRPEQLAVDDPSEPTLTGLALDESVDIATGEFLVSVLWETTPLDWGVTPEGERVGPLPEVYLDGEAASAALDFTAVSEPVLYEYIATGHTARKGRTCPHTNPAVEFEVDLVFALDDGSFAETLTGSTRIESESTGAASVGTVDPERDPFALAGLDIPVASTVTDQVAASLRASTLVLSFGESGWEGEIWGQLCAEPGCGDPTAPDILAHARLATIVPRL